MVSMEKTRPHSGERQSAIPEIDTGLFETKGFTRDIARLRAHLLSKNGGNIGRYCAEQIAILDAPIDPAAKAWELLAVAGKESRGPDVEIDAMNNILLDPSTGIWMAHMIRLQRGDITEEDPDATWGHAGYLHSMAAAAAIEANLDFSLTLPAWDSHVTLPGIGQATLPEQAAATNTNGKRWNAAVVTLANGIITISDGYGNTRCSMPRDAYHESYPNWQPFPQLTAAISGNELPLTLTLDHLNPYRFSKGPIAPQDDTNRLHPEQEAAWANQLQMGMDLLAKDHPVLAKQIAPIMRTVIPSNTTSIRFRPASSSAGDSIGATTIGWQHDAVEMAATLAHEGNHNLLYAHMLTTALLRSGDKRPENLYAPWRDDPRHDYGLLHGVVSFLAVTEFYHQRAMVADQSDVDLKVAQLSFTHWFQQAYYAKEELDRCTELTPEGITLTDQMTERFNAMGNPGVPIGVENLASNIANYHQSRWAAHHLKLTDFDRISLADRWFNGRFAEEATELL